MNEDLLVVNSVFGGVFVIKFLFKCCFLKIIMGGMYDLDVLV